MVNGVRLAVSADRKPLTQMRTMEYEPVIGLEVHVQLKTKTKIFCGCSTEFGQGPNTQVCPVCLGMPGSLPVLNKTVLEFAIKVGLALNCAVQEFTRFDRKHYYYPDLPKNFQISQYDLPVSKDGFIEIEIDGAIRRIGITRAHLEEDAGKLIHEGNATIVDYNRTGIPLLEIVSEPDITSPQEAYEYLTALKSALEYLDVSDCDMEKGSLRCDANISIRPKGTIPFGTKTELKNMNSFKGVRDALQYEITRQSEVVHSGEKIIQQTLLWDEKKEETVAMRTKEEAKDYRYFPEPDLPPFIIKPEVIERIKESIPELPRQKRLRFMKEYGLGEYDARQLVYSKKVSIFAEDCLKLFPLPDKKLVANWLIGPLMQEANARNVTIVDLGITASGLLQLLGYVSRDAISNLTAKQVLIEMIETKQWAQQIIESKNLAQISDTSALDVAAAIVIQENAKSVVDYKAGKENAIMFLVGQVMKKTGGKANPKVVQEILKNKLA